MDIQVKAILKNSHCYLTFSHNFNSMRKAREYIKNLKTSVEGSDTSVVSTLYLNTLRKV